METKFRKNITGKEYVEYVFKIDGGELSLTFPSINSTIEDAEDKMYCLIDLKIQDATTNIETYFGLNCNDLKDLVRIIKKAAAKANVDF